MSLSLATLKSKLLEGLFGDADQAPRQAPDAGPWTDALKD